MKVWPQRGIGDGKIILKRRTCQTENLLRGFERNDNSREISIVNLLNRTCIRMSELVINLSKKC
jgi:hypothetical protein